MTSVSSSLDFANGVSFFAPNLSRFLLVGSSFFLESPIVDPLAGNDPISALDPFSRVFRSS